MAGWDASERVAAILMTAFAVCGAVDRPDEPPPPQLEFVFSETVTLGTAITPGRTARGGRNIIPITGGSFEGPLLRGNVLPGGWDWQLTRSDGCTEVEADYMLRTDDGVFINIVNAGVMCPPAPGDNLLARTHVKFEAPMGKYEWLSKHAFVGTLALAPAGKGPPAVRIRVYRVR